MDEQYQTYVNRVVRLTLPETYKSQLQHIQPSPKFHFPTAGTWQASPFPGYTLITPPWSEDAENHEVYSSLKTYQSELLGQLPANFLVPLPPDSFHLTVADLIWDGAYRHATAENPDFEPQLQGSIQQIFHQLQPLTQGGAPMRWQVLGLMVMPRAMAICLAPKDAQSYERLVQFRRAIYQDPGVVGLGIEQQYLLTAHVTIGYFGQVPSDRTPDWIDQLSDRLSALNQQFFEGTPQELWVHRAELRKFDNMTAYYRQPDWPVLTF